VQLSLSHTLTTSICSNWTRRLVLDGLLPLVSLADVDGGTCFHAFTRAPFTLSLSQPVVENQRHNQPAISRDITRVVVLSCSQVSSRVVAAVGCRHTRCTQTVQKNVSPTRNQRQIGPFVNHFGARFSACLMILCLCVTTLPSICTPY
jgi:hypothetical protein